MTAKDINSNILGTLKVEDVFQDCPDNPDMVIMTLPDEVWDAIGARVGSEIKLEASEKGLIISLIKDRVKQKKRTKKDKSNDTK